MFNTVNQNPGELENWLDDLNPESKVVIPNAYAVPILRNAEVGDTFQFERLGKFNNPLILFLIIFFKYS